MQKGTAVADLACGGSGFIPLLGRCDSHRAISPPRQRKVTQSKDPASRELKKKDGETSRHQVLNTCERVTAEGLC